MQYLEAVLKWQNDLCLFPRQTIQYHSNPSLPWPEMLKKLKLNSSMKTYKTLQVKWSCSVVSDSLRPWGL